MWEERICNPTVIQGANLPSLLLTFTHESMGTIVAARYHSRAWGSRTSLDTKGMVMTTIQARNGARKKMWICIVTGTRLELLLGDRDTMETSIIIFNPEGKEETKNISIPVKLRGADKEVMTKKTPLK